jgi:GntR family transcriptional regulator
MKTAKYIADRIRLLIATKQFQVGEVLPSTRVLGKQLNSSFHTVRKAYQLLAEEGLLKGETGRGFVVTSQNTLLDKSERLEKGAERFRSLLEELIGYGLDEDEVETLFQEQLTFIDWPDRISSCASVGITKELAGMLSSAIRKEVGVKSRVLTTAELDKAANYDALFVPVEHYRLFRTDSESALLLPVIFGLNHELIITTIERSAIQSIGLLAFEEPSLNVLIDFIKHQIRFPGSLTAGALTGRTLPSFVREVDFIFYTEACATIVESQIPERKRARLDFELSSKSATMIRSELWDDY